MKRYLPLLAIIFCSSTVTAQLNEHACRDSLRKVFYGCYTYTHSYEWENYDMPDGTHMEVIPFSDEVTYYELELYRYGSFTREVTSNKEISNYLLHTDFGNWRIDKDTLFLTVTDYGYSDFIYNVGYSSKNGMYYVPVANPIEEKYYIKPGNYFCSQLDCAGRYTYCICYSKKVN